MRPVIWEDICRMNWRTSITGEGGRRGFPWQCCRRTIDPQSGGPWDEETDWAMQHQLGGVFQEFAEVSEIFICGVAYPD